MIESSHFATVLRERTIRREWVDDALAAPDRVENHADKTIHYLKRISENENRWLRVVVNEIAVPPVLVTAFFDRRLRKDDESSSGSG